MILLYFVEQWYEIQKILDIYEAASGQGINKPKIGIFLAQILVEN